MIDEDTAAYFIAHDQAMENGRRLLLAEEMLAKCSARFEHIRRRLINGFQGDPLARLGLADYAAQCVAEIAASVDTLPKGQDAKQGLAGTESGAVGEAETPNPQGNNSPNTTPSVTEAMIEAAYHAFWNSEQSGRERMSTALEAAMKSAAPQHTGLTDIARKLTQIRNVALSAEGHAWDLVIALADEAIAAMQQPARKAMKIVDAAPVVLEDPEGIYSSQLPVCADVERRALQAALNLSRAHGETERDWRLRIVRAALDIPTINEGERNG